MFSLHRRSSLLAFFFSLSLSLTTAGAVDIDPAVHQAVPGDFNGDGRIDALLQPLHSSGRGAILLRDGTGNLSVVAQGWDPGYLGLDWSADNSRITTADLNGDGRADVVIQPLVAGKNASVLITDPTAQLLKVEQVIPAGYLGLDWSTSAHFIVPGDFDGDRQKELLLQAMKPGDPSAIIHADLAGHLVGIVQSIPEGYLGRRWNAEDVTLYVGDFNGDGRQDLLMQVNAGAQEAGESAYALLLADSNGQFTQVNETWNSSDFGADWSPATHTLSLQDLSGTGVMDIVLTSKDPNGTNYVFVPNSQGEFTKPATQWQGPKSARDALNGQRSSASNAAISVTVAPGTGTPPVLKENRAAAAAPLQTAQALGLGIITPNTAGTLEGSAGVDGGNATYNIPIVVPPGRAGMQPQLTLNYSSGGGNGVVGMGWSLTGISAIQRCPDTLAQDGFSRGVNYDYSDRLCLNGKHLILVSGTYGRGGSVYRTELDTFVRIQLYNDMGLTTSYFVVNYKNHRTAYFSSLFTPPGAAAPLAWQITVETDKALNDIVYIYDQSVAGESLIQQINYTGQATSAGVPTVTGDRAVVFGYTPRPDTGSGYLAGGLLSQTRLLSTITTNNSLPNLNLRSYTLNYQVSGATGRSLLQNVQGCGLDSQQYQNCVAPTTFQWQQQAQSYRLITSYNLPDYDTTQVSQPTPTPSNPATNLLPSSISVGGDYNGDGRKELVYYRDSASHILFIDGDGNVQQDFDFDSLLPSPNSPVPQYWLQTLDKDINNDGAADLLVDDNGTLGVASWNGSAFVVADTNIPTTLATYTLIGDMNGDGLNDIITEEKDNTTGDQCIYVYYNLNPKTLTFSARTKIADLTAMGTDAWGDRIDAGIPAMGPDLNGDGIPDILITEKPGPNLMGDVTNGSNFVAVLMSQVAPDGTVTFNALRMPDYGVADATIVENDWFYLIDINGDGLPDLVFSDDYPSNWNGGSPSSHWFYQINTGKGFLPPQDTGVLDTRVADYDATGWQEQVAKMFTVEADLNNDGTKELIFPKTHLAYYCPTVVVQTAEHGIGPHKVCAGPLDGDYRQTLYDIAPSFDHSIFAYSSLQFVQQPDHTFTVVENDNTGIVAQGGFATVGDLQGDGLTSIFSPFTRFYYDAYWGTLADQLGDMTCPPGYPCQPSVSSNIRVTGAYDPNGYHTDAAPDMMLSATNGLGSTSSWDYLPLSTTQNGFYYAPPIGAANRYADSNDGFNDYVYFSSSMYVVSDYTQDNGLGGGSGDTHNFHYSQAIYNTRGRGFQGFYGIVDDDLVAGLRSVELFHQRFPLSGLVSESWVEPLGETLDLTNLAVPSDGHFLDHVSNVAACEVGQHASWLQSQAPVYDVDGVHCVFGVDGPGFWPYNRRVTTVKQDANYNPLSTTVTNLSYDGHGNYTGGDSTTTDASGSYSQTATDVYATADTSGNWWVDQLQSKTVTTATTYSTPLIASANGSITRSLNYDYYQDGTQRLKDEYADQGTGYEKDTAYTYDQYGNLQAQTISSPVALPGAYGSLSNGQDYGIAARTITTNYNFEGYFPNKITDALGHTTTIDSVDPGTGRPMTVMDPNGVYSNYEYDFLGRKTVDIESPLPGTSFSYTAASAPGIGTCPSTAVYAVNSTMPYNPRHTTCLDSLNRTVRTIVDGFTASNPTLVDTNYDSLGRTVETSEPYKSSAGGPQAWNLVNNYDIQNRPLKKTDPEGVVTTYSYTGLITDITTTPPDSPWASGGPVRVDEETRNSLGKLLSVENGKGSGGTTDSLMQYRYDAAGNPVLIQDGNSNQIVASFNIVGQKIAVSDPDMGNWTYVYDVLGELLQQTDAKGNVMAQSYDLLGRVTTRTKPETAPAVTDTWTYDSCSYGIGKLCNLNQASDGYAEAYTYDSFSRVIRDHVVVNGSAYNTLTTYDLFSGKVATTAYPASYPDVPPVPNAGSNQTVALDSASGTMTVSLNGSASTVTNTTYPVLYTWTQIACASSSGPSVQLSNPNAISPTFTASVVANYCFQLAVSDGFLAPTASVMVTVTPSAPGTLTLASDQGNGISYDGVFILNWGNAAGADYFQLSRATDGVTFTIQTPTYTLLTATVGGGSTTADLTYTYKMQACAQNGICGPFGNTTSVTVYLLPGVPPSINFPAFSNLDGTIPVSWAASGGVVTAYYVKLGEKKDTASGGYIWVDGQCTATPPSTSCTIPYGFGTAGGYNYGEVYACNGPHCGGALMAGNQVYIQQPAAPTISGGGSTTTGNATISWTSVTNANDYRLYQSLESSSSHAWGAYSLTYNGSAIGHTISLGNSSVAGHYYVLACVGTTGTNCTPASNTVTVTYVAPAAVTVTAPSPATTGVEPVSWTTSSGATNYQLTATYRELAQHTAGPTVIYSGGATSYNDAFPSTATSGTYTVVACNVIGCSAVSNSASFTYNQLGGGGGGGGCTHCAKPRPPQSPRIAPPEAGSGSVPASSGDIKPSAPLAHGTQGDAVHEAVRVTSSHAVINRPRTASAVRRTAPLYAPPVYIAYAGAHLEPAAVTTVSARLTVQYQYTATGYMQSQFNAIYPSQVFWTANSLDAFGQVTQQTDGNGVTSTITTNQDPLGRVTAIVTSTPNAAGNCNNSLVQNTSYSWYSVGDMKQRTWQSIPPGCGTPVNPTETFSYDVLNRLSSTTLNGTSAAQSMVTYTYDLMGNITSRSDAGGYAYGGVANAGPHAVTKVTNAQGVATAYGYDPDGNMNARGSTNLQWDDVYSLPTCIDASGGTCTDTSTAANWSKFSYAPDKHRYYQDAYVNGVEETTVYLGNLEIVTIGGVSQFRHRLSAYGKDVLTLDWDSDGSLPKYNYEHDDNLGGMDAITDASGAVMTGTAFGYDAFGRRRDPASGQVPQSVSEVSTDRSSTHRGFTNHEMLDNVGLVHMNGRVYDPVLGRFLSVDPEFQFPTNSQSVNPYSYVLNNPLSNADPTGYCTSGAEPPADTTDCKDETKGPTAADIAAHLPNFVSCSGCVFMLATGNGQQNGQESSTSTQTKTTVSTNIGTPQSAAKNAPATSESLCVTGSGSEGSCGQGSDFDPNKERKDLLAHTYTHELKSTSAMDKAMVAKKDSFDHHANGESVIVTTSEGIITNALLQNARNSCAVAEIPLDAAGVGHDHLFGNDAETLARELPGPLDMKPLTNDQVVYIFTDTGAVRKIEVLKVGDNKFEPVLTTLDPGKVFTTSRQVNAIDKWNRTWDDRKNLQVMEKVQDNP